MPGELLQCIQDRALFLWGRLDLSAEEWRSTVVSTAATTLIVQAAPRRLKGELGSTVGALQHSGITAMRQHHCTGVLIHVEGQLASFGAYKRTASCN